MSVFKSKNFIIVNFKKFTPKGIKSLLITIIANIPFTKERSIRKEKNRNYSKLPISDTTESSLAICIKEAISVYGENWNFQSDALRREMVFGFQTCIYHLLNKIDNINYLEIGSCQGLSMSIIGNIIRNNSKQSGKLLSIDPYFEDGYFEHNIQVPVNKTIKSKAFSLYNKLSLDVQHIE